MTNFDSGDAVRAAKVIDTNRFFGQDIKIGTRGTIIRVDDRFWSTKYVVNFDGTVVEDVPEDSLHEG